MLIEQYGLIVIADQYLLVGWLRTVLFLAVVLLFLSFWLLLQFLWLWSLFIHLTYD